MGRHLVQSSVLRGLRCRAGPAAAVAPGCPSPAPRAVVPCHQASRRAAGVWHGAAIRCPPASRQPWSPALSLQQGVLIAVCLVAGMKRRSMMMWSPLGCSGEVKAFCCPPCPGHQHICAPDEVGTGGAGMLLGVSTAAQGAPGPPQTMGSGARAEHSAPTCGRAMVSVLPCKWETLIPSMLGTQTQGLVPGGKSSCCCFGLVTCLSGSVHPAAALPGFGFAGGDAGRASNRVALLPAAQR